MSRLITILIFCTILNGCHSPAQPQKTSFGQDIIAYKSNLIEISKKHSETEQVISIPLGKNVVIKQDTILKSIKLEYQNEEGKIRSTLFKYIQEKTEKIVDGSDGETIILHLHDLMVDENNIEYEVVTNYSLDEKITGFDFFIPSKYTNHKTYTEKIFFHVENLTTLN